MFVGITDGQGERGARLAQQQPEGREAVRIGQQVQHAQQPPDDAEAPHEAQRHEVVRREHVHRQPHHLRAAGLAAGRCLAPLLRKVFV